MTKYGPFSHGFTCAAHPLGAAVALANLDIIERERLMENAARQGALLRRRLSEYRAAPGGRANSRLKTCLKMLGRFAEDVMLPPQTVTPAQEHAALRTALSIAREKPQP